MLQNFIDTTDPLHFEQTKNCMQIAARIDDILKFKKINRKKFAKMMSINDEEISDILYGKNFTIAELTKIAFLLEINLIELFKTK